jgi:hypothetical protein
VTRPLLAFCVPCNKEQPTIRRGLRSPRHCMVCHEPVQTKSKFNNVPTRSKHTDRVFQSRKEANREPTLLALQNAGEITDLQYQVPFRLELFGTQAVEALLDYVGDTGVGDLRVVTLTTLLRDVERSRQCVAIYKADFTYRTKAGELVVEDPKGARTPVYTIKKRLMVLAHNIEIQEPSEGGVQQRARGCGVAGRGTGARLMGGR